MEHLCDFELFEKEKTNQGNTYSSGDIVIINYWENGELVPVKILKKYSKNKYAITYDVNDSVLSGAPDDIISGNDIISVVSAVDDPAEKPLVVHLGQTPISNDMTDFPI